MKTKMKKAFAKLATIAIASSVLVACGKNNKVGGAGGMPGAPGIWNGSPMVSPGTQMTGVQTIDNALNSVRCTNPNSNGSRVALTFAGQNGYFQRGSVSAYSSGMVRLGKTMIGDIAIYKDLGQGRGELTLMMCVDSVFNQNTINQINQIGVQILNNNVTQMNGYGDFIADVYHQFSPTPENFFSIR